MDLVDTHCHIQFDAYKDQENAVLARAAQAGVRRVICVGTSLDDSKLAVSLAKNNNDIWAAVGTHPHDAKNFLADINSAKKLRQLASESRVVAIGETGLDYYKQHSEKADQQAAFRQHLELAEQIKLPVILHIREAFDDFFKIFDEFKNLSGVVHSFSSDITSLEQILERGLYVGLNGIMTFTKDKAQLDAAKKVPLDRLLLETDAPFLTPAPNRNELCEPSHIKTIAEFLSNLRGEPIELLAMASTKNAEKLFNLR